MVQERSHGSVILLTGAGASAALGLPTMAGFLESAAGSDEDLARIIARIDDPSVSSDVEALYHRLEIYSEIAAAVSRGDRNLGGLLTGWDEAAQPGNALSRFALLGLCAADALLRMEQLMVKAWGRVDAIRAEQVYGEILLWLHQRARGPIAVFTTNYDLTFEGLSSRWGDGHVVTGVSPRGRDLVWCPANYASASESTRLVVYRLHGCSHWFSELGEEEILYYPEPPGIEAGHMRVRPVIFPGGAKTELLHMYPFSVAYRALRRSLQTARVCLVVGYSFRDVGVQEAIADASPRTSFVVVDPGLPEDAIGEALEGHTFVHLPVSFGHAGTDKGIRDAVAGLRH